MNEQQIATIVAQVVAQLSQGTVTETVPEVPAEPEVDKYIIYIGKKPRKVKATYIAINADGQLSGFTEEADVLGEGTDKVGKRTLEEIEEKFPQFNHPDLLVKAK